MENPSEKLFIAIEKGDLSKVRVLLNQGVSIDTKNYYGLTPLYYAITHQKWGIAKFLVSAGANIHTKIVDPNFSEKVQRTMLKDADNCLSRAVSRGNLETVKLLVKKGADIQFSSSKGNLLHYAIKADSFDTIQYLVQLGVNINARSTWQNTPLHLAIRLRRKREVIVFLIDNGARTDVLNTDNKSPLDLAREYRNFVAEEVLLGKNKESKYGNISSLKEKKHNMDRIIKSTQNAVPVGPSARSKKEEEKILELEYEIQTLNKRIGNRDEKILHLETQLRQKDTDKNNFLANNRQLTDQIKNLNSQLQDKNELTDWSQELEKEVSKLEHSNRSKQQTIDELEKDIKFHKDKIVEIHTAHKREISELRQTSGTIERERELSIQRQQEFEKKREAEEAERKRLEEERLKSDLENENTRLRNELKTLKDNNPSTARINELFNKIRIFDQAQKNAEGDSEISDGMRNRLLAQLEDLFNAEMSALDSHNDHLVGEAERGDDGYNY